MKGSGLAFESFFFFFFEEAQPTDFEKYHQVTCMVVHWSLTLFFTILMKLINVHIIS